MYSISNDENDYYAGYYYDSGYRGAENVPFYPYVGAQPLVYYSHIAENPLPQRNKIAKKNNPNCFVKAFRWYTQELPSPQIVAPCNNTNIGGFATWLDKKYEEYLQDNQCENNCLQYRSKPCSCIKSDRTINRIEDPSRKTRKFPRLKSPWKKKRRYINENERDTVCEKQSFEFILRPQDMSRPASECCQKTSYCIRSDTTFITSKSAIPTNIKKKSKSLMCISKTKDEFEKDIMITNYDVSQCYKKQNSEERLRIAPNPTPMKISTKKIICNCFDTDLEKGMHYDNVATTRNQSKLVNCQCATQKQDVFNKISYSKLHENVHNINGGKIKTRGSREESRIVTEYAEVTNQKLCSTSSNKSKAKDVICGCDQLDSKRLSSYDKVASRRNRYKSVICQCSMSNFLSDEARYQNQCNTSEVFKKMSQNDLNRNEYDDNKYTIQRQTSTEMTRVVTKCSKQTNETEDCNSRSYRKNIDVICECYQTTQEKLHQTCCPCPKPLDPKLRQAPQIRRSSINLNGMKTLKYKEPFKSKELPVHGVQTSDHSIRFLEDSFLVKIV
ncbi:PREDICTED: uncharacterized protein LOC106117523 isoform X2 [Papilio xuthus]|uniref:Uncharacterized protein LOC106117523 isoform X2 n=1 Tax=Papilio xuthus TaxID=66420 RepID=A0AAJ6Z8G9_PAPXU|nr:PREDICTED: uncharacterized protein LOC106117523 isoform X2 [Papilio xuthus]